MRTDYTNRGTQELRVLVYFKYLYEKYTKEGAIYATEKNFKEFGELVMYLAASIFKSELECSLGDVYPPKSNFDLVRIMFALTDKYLMSGNKEAKEIAKIYMDCVKLENEELTMGFEREAKNKDVVMRMGESNVRFLDSSWGNLMDYDACVRQS